MQPLLDQLKGLDVLAGAEMGGRSVQLQPIPGHTPVIQVSIEGRDELPIFVTSSDMQIICICYLWAEEEVKPARRTELLESLLDLNPSVPCLPSAASMAAMCSPERWAAMPAFRTSHARLLCSATTRSMRSTPFPNS